MVDREPPKLFLFVCGGNYHKNFASIHHQFLQKLNKITIVNSTNKMSFLDRKLENLIYGIGCFNSLYIHHYELIEKL